MQENPAAGNPIIFKDPDGNIVPLIMGAIWLGGAAITAYDTYQTYKQEGAKAAAGTLVKDAIITAATGGAAKLALKAIPASMKEKAAEFVVRETKVLVDRVKNGKAITQAEQGVAKAAAKGETKFTAAGRRASRGTITARI